MLTVASSPPCPQTPARVSLLLLCLAVVFSCPLPASASSSASPYTCPAKADYTGASIPNKPWLDRGDGQHQPDLPTPPSITRHFASELVGEQQCPKGLYSSSPNHGTRVKRLGHEYYELRDFCIRPFFQGGLTLFRPRDMRGHRMTPKGGGMEVCTEVRCAVYPVTFTKRQFPCRSAKWVSGASALILPLTNGNPWHFLHHLLPLTQVLHEGQSGLMNSTVHLYTALASRPDSTAVASFRRRSRRWHPFPARTYFSPWRFKWWPLLAATLPPGISMLQVDHLELLQDDPEFAGAQGSTASVCYRHGILGVPLLFRHDTTRHPKPLVPLSHIQAFRQRALKLAGAAPPRQPSKCRGKGLFGPSDQPLLGFIVRTGFRKLCNLNKIAEAAAALGFKVELVAFEELNVFEQLRAASRFDFLVGVHGAGMTNVFWLHPAAAALEMYPAPPNEPLKAGEGVNPGSNYGRLAELASARHTVWIQQLGKGKAEGVPFRLHDVTMDVGKFKVVAADTLKAWKKRFCK